METSGSPYNDRNRNPGLKALRKDGERHVQADVENAWRAWPGYRRKARLQTPPMNPFLQLNHASPPPLRPATRYSAEFSAFAKASADRCAGTGRQRHPAKSHLPMHRDKEARRQRLVLL